MTYFKRDIEDKLTTWKNKKGRKPLIVKGARQVGKSSTIREWGRKEFGQENYLEINFEEKSSLKELFKKDLDVGRITEELELIFGRKIVSGSFLLFFDEVQTVPEAIMSLRYFYEKKPDLHVIAAGSLIDFVLEEISFPVGRVDLLTLSPLSFYEFLTAIERRQLVELIINCVLEKKPIPDLVHKDLLSYLKKYLVVGGMPEAVARYQEEQSIIEGTSVHKNLLGSYKLDFAKYSKKTDWDVLNEVFDKSVKIISSTKVKYSSISRENRSYKVKKAIELLKTAGVLHKVFHSSAKVLPLNLESNRDVFKILFLDVGLVNTHAGFDWSQVQLNVDLTDVFKGVLAEQFVGQELIANNSNTDFYQNHYWCNLKRGRSAEVDYLIEYQGDLCPLEVKSGSRGTLKSLALYMKKQPIGKAIVLSQRNIEEMEGVSWFPLYCAGALMGNS